MNEEKDGIEEEVEVREEGEEETSPPDDVFAEYPKHVESFECYFWLGERRTMWECAKIRFKETVPGCNETDIRYKTKMNSFYTKIKRWAWKEHWKEWVKRKETEDRIRNDAEMREKVVASQKNIMGYRALVQQGIVAFSRKLGKSVKLLNAIMSIEEQLMHPDIPTAHKKDAEERLKLLRKDLVDHGIEIRSFKEAKDMIELDVYLSKIVDQMPEQIIPDKRRLPESEADKVDRLMEYLRKKAPEAFVDAFEEKS
jgi:hypothetical protein